MRCSASPHGKGEQSAWVPAIALLKKQRHDMIGDVIAPDAVPR
ncbi:MAG: hypothetical protein ACFB12_08730 [Leptolyngbyaceae cyanobacterium]